MEQLLTALGVSNAAELNLGALTLTSVLNALLALVVCLIAIKIVMTIFTKLLGKTSMDERVRRYALTAIRTVLWILTVLIVADALGIPVTSLVAILSVFTLAISLAVQSVLSVWPVTVLRRSMPRPMQPWQMPPSRWRLPLKL